MMDTFGHGVICESQSATTREDLMSDALTLAELHSLQLELLPARTVLSMLTLGPEGTNGANGADGNPSTGMPQLNVAGIPVGIP